MSEWSDEGASDRGIQREVVGSKTDKETRGTKVGTEHQHNDDNERRETSDRKIKAVEH